VAKYLARRVLSLAPVLLVVSVVIFLLIHLTPGDPAAAMLGDQATPSEVAALRERLGLNDPLPAQYWRWLVGVFSGDLGESLFISGPMTKILADRLLPTLQLTSYAVLLACVFSVPLGMTAAARRNSAADQAISGLSIAGISLPSFLVGIGLMYVFAVKLRWIPSSGYKPVAQYGWREHLRYMVAPAVSLGLIEAGLMTRMTRSSMLDILHSDYMRMAKAKGVGPFAMFAKHALKNAAIGVVTVVGLSFMSLLAGATVTETIFGIPGIGQLTIVSVTRRDYEVIQAIVLLVSVTNVLVMLLMDLAYAALDPRVRLAE
jgi:peptide/nickel transport system permease protein